jgi:hypothetical protein
MIYHLWCTMDHTGPVMLSMCGGVLDASSLCTTLISIHLDGYPCTRTQNTYCKEISIFDARVHGNLSKSIETKASHRLEASWTPPPTLGFTGPLHSVLHQDSYEISFMVHIGPHQAGHALRQWRRPGRL